MSMFKSRSASKCRMPDIIVGIDIGMCYTKVAYLAPVDGFRTNIKLTHVNNWPRGGESLVVPTVIAYRRGETHTPEFFGFRPPGSPNTDLEVFKTFKNEFPNGSVKPEGNTKDSKSRKAFDIYVDFLQAMHPVIGAHYTEAKGRTKTWDASFVEFVFSVPATDRKKDVFGQLVRAAKLAGYEKNGRVSDTLLTEPEASVSYSMEVSSMLEIGQNVLVVDIGGATSDLCLVKIKPQSKVAFCTFHPVASINVGGDQVTQAVASMCYEFLCTHFEVSPGLNLHDAASEVVSLTVRTTKYETMARYAHAVGDRVISLPPHFTAKNTAPTDGDIYLDHGILRLSTNYIRRQFDEMISGTKNTRGIKSQIDSMLENMATELPSRPLVLGDPSSGNYDSPNVDNIHFSGGCGANFYIRSRIMALLDLDRTREPEPFHRNIPNLTATISPSPQLCVAGGLVLYRIAEIAEEGEGEWRGSDEEGGPVSKMKRFLGHFVQERKEREKRMNWS